MSEPVVTPAHDMKVTHSYTIHCFEHEPRDKDPHKHDFDEFKRRRKSSNTYHCDFAIEHRNGDFSECDLTKPLECHHKHIEFALKNGVDITLLEKDYPGVSKQGIGAWIDSAENLELLCIVHHRSHAGKHVAAYADFEGEIYIRGLIS